MKSQLRSQASGERETLEQGQSWINAAKVSVEDMSLHVEEGPHQGQEIPLTKSLFYIGRADWCDLPLPKDRRVSSLHCELRIDELGIRLRDLDSRNGCLMGEQKILDAYLSDGARIKLGDTLCVLRSNAKRTEIDVECADDSGTLVGKNPGMRKIFALLKKLSAREMPMLLTGETGTGKSTIAQAIHRQSARKNGPFVMVNCGALSPSLIESELFGYEKGAFTGANKLHRGFFEQAHGGTLFLDEIAELPLELQPKLLDVLERKKVRRIGASSEIDVDFRLVSATHRQLKEEQEFREDLYYRIAVLPLEVPPLRERPEDIPLLVGLMLPKIASEPVEITTEALRKLQGHLWPGNVRELRNVLERSIAWLDGHKLEARDLALTSVSPSSSPAAAPPPTPRDPAPGRAPGQRMEAMKDRLALAEKQIIEETLEDLYWNVSKAAQILEVSRSWLYGRMKSHGIQRPTEREEPS